MSRDRLLERLTGMETKSEKRTPSRILKDSILQHLTGLLNTRQGSVPIDDLYGIPDLSNVAGSFAVGTSESIVSSILRAVARYETRLLKPQMQSSTEERQVITLKYILSGFIELEDRQLEAFLMILRVNSAGRISLEEKHGV